MFGESSVFTQNQLYKYPKHSDVFIFNWSRFFFVKIQKFWGAPIETSDFLQICADFDRIWHKHAGLRPACEDRANTRETCEQKTLKKQVVRKRAKRANNRANRQPGKNRSCEHRAGGANISSKFHFWQKFHQKNPQFCPTICIFKFLTENRMGLLKQSKHLFLTENPPEFALKSAYWIFWPILARFFQKPAHFKLFTEDRLSFPRKLLCLTLTKNRPTLPSNLRILASALKSTESAQKFLQSKLLTENEANLHTSTFCLECARFVTAIHILIQAINMRR